MAGKSVVFSHWFLVPLLLLPLACAPEVDPPAPTSTTRQSCTPHLEFCEDNTAKKCGANGYVDQREKCGVQQSCMGGRCRNNVICVPDAYHCVGNQLVHCNAEGTALASSTDCGSGVCANGACQPVADVCPPLAFVCVGDAMAVCNGDGSGYSVGPDACGADVCLDGSCRATICDPGQASCSGDTSRTCNLWGTAFSQETVCIGAESCIHGQCQTRICEPGDSCRSGRLVTCNSDGTVVIEDRACREGTTCLDGRCVTGSVDAGFSQVDAHLVDLWAADRRQPDSGVLDLSRPDAFVGVDRWTADSYAFDSTPPNCDLIDDNYEPNESAGQAAAVSNSQTVNGLVACDAEDWYTTTVSSGDALRITIAFSHEECDLDLYVYQAGSTEPFATAATSADTEVADYDGPVGTVFIKVLNYNYPAKTGNYSLAVQVVAPPVCGDNQVTGSETCDTAIASGQSGACPTSCSHSGCSLRSLARAGTCYAHCESTQITHCQHSDGCCPDACTGSSDNDCPSGWTACSGDSSCPAERYCDLAREQPVCKTGCRIGVASTCDSTHTCASDHRCVLSNVVPHQRCAACSDTDPCDNGFTCVPLLMVCAASCNLFVDECPTLVGPNEQCLLTLCSQSDCP